MTEPHPGMIARVFAVLGAFSENRTRLTQSDIARVAELPLPTVHRLCRQLVEHGALERGDDGAYSVGVRLWELGSLAPRAHGLRQVALPYLEDLYEATHENVQLVVLDGSDALYIERLSSRTAVPLISRAGGRLPLHASSGGLILLAHSGTELLDTVLSAELVAYTPSTVTDGHRLRSILADIRRTGVVVCREYLNVGSMAIAAPVRRGTEVVAAVSVVVSIRDDPAPVIPALRAACRAISRGLV